MKAPHKQSGSPDNPNNFNNHKEASRDYVDGRRVQIYDRKVWTIYTAHTSVFITEHATDFP